MSDQNSVTETSSASSARSQVTAQLHASKEARGVGIRLHLADVQLARVTDQPWSALTAHEKTAYDGRGALAVNTGNVDALERALEDAALALRLRMNPAIVPDIETARALATAAVSVWIASMSGQKGRL